MKYETCIVSLMISSLAGSSLAFSPPLALKRWNQGHNNVWNHQRRQGREYRRPVTETHQDAFRLMNSYLDSLGSVAADSPSAQSQGVTSFHPQRARQHPSKSNVGQDVIETTATDVAPMESPTAATVPNENVQNQYFPQPQYSMQQPSVTQQAQQQTQPNPNTGAPPTPTLQQQYVDMQQPIPPNHETGHLNHQPHLTAEIPGSQLPPIPPNVPIPQPPELQPPPTTENFDPHNPNFGTGTQQIYGQPPPMQQPPMQQPYPQGSVAPPQQQTMQQQPGTQAYQMYQPQTTATYPYGSNVAPQMQQQQQQQQQVPYNQVQTQTQAYNPSTGSFPQQDLPIQGQPADMNSQLMPQQQQQYGSFPQQNTNVAGSWGNTRALQAPPYTQQTMAQQPLSPPGQQFDPHEVMNQQRTNANGGNWYDVRTRNPNRKFDTVNPLERDNPQWLPPRNQQQTQLPTQPAFDPHSPSWDRPMPGTPAAAAALVTGGTTNLQGTSWHNDPNSWQGSQGLPYQNHPMNPLAAGMPVGAVAPPPLQPMKQSRRQPFDPHNPDWTRPLSSEIQGESRNTWHNHMGVPRVMVDLYSEGRPIDSEVELWQGPSNTPHKIKMYSEDGGIRPFKAMVETPGYGSSIDIKNSGPTAFPIQANVQPMLFRYEPERFKQVQGENSLYTVSLNDYATSALVTLETDGMPLMAQVELWQGPDNTPQKVKIYNEQGLPFQLMVETPGPQCTIAVRNIGPLEFPLYCAVSARVD